jgi:hypothetical protein
MVGKSFDLFGQSVRIQRLEGSHNARVEVPPVLLLKALIGYLVGEGVLKPVGEFCEQSALIEELALL